MSNSTTTSDSGDISEKVKHVDVTKLWAEFDGKSGVQQNITAPPDAIAPNLAGTREAAGSVTSAADADKASAANPAAAKAPASAPAPAPAPAST